MSAAQIDLTSDPFVAAQVVVETCGFSFATGPHPVFALECIEKGEQNCILTFLDCYLSLFADHS
jgi:hypothetical protein